MLSIVGFLTVVIMLIAALAVVMLHNLIAAVAAVSVMSLALSVLFILLQAPDVALAEAAVGAGLSGVLFALTLRKTGLWQIETDSKGESTHD